MRSGNKPNANQADPGANQASGGEVDGCVGALEGAGVGLCDGGGG